MNLSIDKRSRQELHDNSRNCLKTTMKKMKTLPHDIDSNVELFNKHAVETEENSTI